VSSHVSFLSLGSHCFWSRFPPCWPFVCGYLAIYYLLLFVNHCYLFYRGRLCRGRDLRTSQLCIAFSLFQGLAAFVVWMFPFQTLPAYEKEEEAVAAKLRGPRHALATEYIRTACSTPTSLVRWSMSRPGRILEQQCSINLAWSYFHMRRATVHVMLCLSLTTQVQDVMKTGLGRILDTLYSFLLKEQHASKSTEYQPTL
jgi:hypothetical protein